MGHKKSKCYIRGKNWSSNRGSYFNGQGRRIYKPKAYFYAVSTNKYGYNSCYRNGNGEKVRKPKAYYYAVATDRYGYNS